jgi:ABC-2 type transport system ATP-binding protein
MSLNAFRLLCWLAISSCASGAALVFVRVDPPLTHLRVLPSLLAAIGAAALLFVLLSGQALWPGRPSLRGVGSIGVKGIYLTIMSAAEEVLWRWLVLGGLVPVVGLAAAFLASTVGFAFAHAVRRRGIVAVHLATGSVFGAVYVFTGRLGAAILAHALYNWLVVAAVESAERVAPLPAAVGVRLRGRSHKGAKPPIDKPAMLDGVRKRYGMVEALRDFSLTLDEGEVVALLGPNGAGKTTALSILLGLRAPDEGTARIFGRDPRDPHARQRLGATPQETGFPTTLKVTEVVDLVRAHYPASLETADVLARFGLVDVARRQVGGLSGGQKRRLAVGLAFVGDPSAVFLDEPTTGLDVEARRRVWDVVRTYAERGRTVLLTTHHLEEADALASRVVVIADGATIAEGSPSEVKARVGLRRIRVEADSLPEVAGVEHATRAGRVHTLYAADPGPVVELLVERGVLLDGLEVTPVTLEEAFLFLTGRPG